MKCYLCAISCGVGAGRSVGRKKGKKENRFLNSSYNVWKTFIHSIHLSGFHVITSGQKKKKSKKEAGGRWWGQRETGIVDFNGETLECCQCFHVKEILGLQSAVCVQVPLGGRG